MEGKSKNTESDAVRLSETRPNQSVNFGMQKCQQRQVLLSEEQTPPVFYWETTQLHPRGTNTMNHVITEEMIKAFIDAGWRKVESSPSYRLGSERQALREKIAEAFYGGTIPKEADFEAFDSYSEWDKAIKEAYKKADSILDLTEAAHKQEVERILSDMRGLVVDTYQSIDRDATVTQMEIKLIAGLDNLKASMEGKTKEQQSNSRNTVRDMLNR